MVACFLWLGWRAVATFSSEAPTGVLAIQVARVSYPEKVSTASLLFPLSSFVNLDGLSAMCLCDSNVYLGVNAPHCRRGVSEQEEGEGGWDWD